MSKRIIPQVPKSGDHARMRFDEAVRENLQIMTGQRVDVLAVLPSSASLADVIAKINEIVNRLQ